MAEIDDKQLLENLASLSDLECTGFSRDEYNILAQAYDGELDILELGEVGKDAEKIFGEYGDYGAGRILLNIEFDTAEDRDGFVKDHPEINMVRAGGGVWSGRM